MARYRHCGPWRETPVGTARHCDHPLRVEAPEPSPSKGPTHKEPQREAELPPVKEPPAAERVVITERTPKIARKLIESVFTEGATS